MKKKRFLAALLLVNLCAASFLSAENEEAVRYDFLIKNAVVYDGVSERPWFGDLALRDGKIVEIGERNPDLAEEMLDSAGLAVAPGFIDVHTHSDFNALVYPDHFHKIMQGVTTEIAGNCGMSAAPVEGALEKEIHAVWAREGVIIPESLGWHSVAGYARSLEAAGLASNLALLIGHGNLRFMVMGAKEGPASPAEIEAMQRHVQQAMQEGAIGVSFGLGYFPGTYASEDELTALCSTVAKLNGICAFHIRSESASLLESLEETVRIAERSGVRVQISHLKAGGSSNWYKIDGAFRILEDARKKGLPVYADAYPYTASYAELGVQLPDRYYLHPDRKNFFKSAANREEVIESIQRYYGPDHERWKNIMIGHVAAPEFKHYEGLRLAEIAAVEGREPARVLVELLAAADFEVSAFNFSQSPDVVEQVLNKPYVMAGSDSVADGSRYPHPRVYGTFPRFLTGHEGEALAERIRRVTALPAEYFNLGERGKIRPGYWADLVIFDPAGLRDQATYQQPAQRPEGVRWVFLNGLPVVREGEALGLKSGQFLGRARDIAPEPAV